MTQQAVEQRKAASESMIRGHNRLTLGDFVSCSPEALLSALGGVRASQQDSKFQDSKVDDANATLQASISGSKVDVGRTPHASVTASVASVAAVIRAHSLPPVAAPMPPIQSGRAEGRLSDPSASRMSLTGSKPASSRSTRTMCDP